jgi:hypothetical protein
MKRRPAWQRTWVTDQEDRLEAERKKAAAEERKLHPPGNPDWRKGGPSPHPGGVARASWMRKKGRPKAEFELARKAREHGPECIRYLMSVVRNKKEETKNRMAATTEVLDRGFGKAQQEITTTMLKPVTEFSDAELQSMIDRQRRAETLGIDQALTTPEDKTIN